MSYLKVGLFQSICVVQVIIIEIKMHHKHSCFCLLFLNTTVKILKIGTPEIITIIVLQLEQLDFTVQYCVQKMQIE